MSSLALSQDVINVISKADDARVIRALDALHSGSMTVSYRMVGAEIRASVSSIVWKGKKHPVCEEHHYTVTLGPYTAECSCPDHQYRSLEKGPCKHLLLTAMVAQEQGREEQKQAA